MTDDDQDVYNPVTNPLTLFNFGIQQAPEVFKPVTLTDSMQKAITAALADIPQDKTIAIVATATGDGIETHFAARVSDHWQVAAIAQRPWKPAEGGGILGTGVEVFAQIKGTW